jgi:catechol 2,3-dioxygenase-like lactoylglutathione lyase family enzyme
MRIEHLAFQVPDPQAFAAWYGQHLGTIVRRSTGALSHTHFLAASDGAVLLEIRRNESAPVPDYAAQDPLVLHLAFVSDDPRADAARLVEAGARMVSGPTTTEAGDVLCMLRDPWGLPIQLCQRREPML